MLRTIAFALTATTAIALAAPLAAADELTAAYARVLADPTNSEVSIHYAQLAEARGEFRKALSAYERVLVNDPDNTVAREGLQRVRRIIQPAETKKTVEVGATWDSNALRSPMATGDVLGYGSFRLKDERAHGLYRWRTNLNLYGEAYANQTDMNYASINGDVGPVMDIKGTNMSVRPGVGLGTAFFEGRNYYWDVNATALFEGYLNGAYQWLRFRAGYRQYDQSFTANAGSYVDVTGHFAVQDVFHDHDVLSVSPWVRWSGIDGLPDNGSLDFATGLYIEGGANFEYAKAISDSLSAAVNVKVSDRLYNDIGIGSRQDWYVAPGASLTFKNLLGPQGDLRLDYKYEWNSSNMADHTWQNQSATIAVVFRR
jgi:tetratricopeptide (TPR) repeat protein